jgi:hypothetical protein
MKLEVEIALFIVSALLTISGWYLFFVEKRLRRNDCTLLEEQKSLMLSEISGSTEALNYWLNLVEARIQKLNTIGEAIKYNHKKNETIDKVKHLKFEMTITCYELIMLASNNRTMVLRATAFFQDNIDHMNKNIIELAKIRIQNSNNNEWDVILKAIEDLINLVESATTA